MSGSTLNAVPFRSTIFYTAAGTPAALGTVFTVGANGIQSTTNALGLQSLLASTMTASTVSFSTMTASTILTQASTITLAQNVNVPNRFVEIGCDLANSMYLDFHSSDAALPDYSTRIISQGGATTGTGGLNMYASTIGLVATNGVGIGTTAPSAALHIKNATTAMRITGNLTNASTRPAITTTPGAFEIRGSSATEDTYDDGFLRLSAGGGFNTNQQVYIDLSGYSTVADMGSNIVFGAQGTERMRITAAGNVGIGTTAPNSALTVAGNIAPSVTTTHTLGTDSYVWNGVFTTAVVTKTDTLSLYSAPGNGTANGLFNFIHNGSSYASLSQGRGPSLQFYAQGDIMGGIYCLSNNSTSPSSAYYAITIRNTNGINNNILYMVPTNATQMNMYPGADNGSNLGISGSRWLAVYAVNGAIQTSDSKEKDAVPLSYGLNEILQVRTIKYKWKSQAELPDDAPEKNYQYYGFCADELAPIFPELVYNEDPKVPVQMNYSEIMPVMVNAIKEQNATIVSLQAQVAMLEARLVALESK